MLMHLGGCYPNDCQFPRITIGDEPMPEPDDPLQPGMEVMGPCENCGLTANEYMAYLESDAEEYHIAMRRLFEFRNPPLFHWSTSNHRNQIVRYGLKPGMRPTTHAEFRAPYICFSDDPAWAWALSGGMPYTPDGEWDLWQTWYEHLDDPVILASRDGNGVHEYRTFHRVYKRNVKYLGSRIKL